MKRANRLFSFILSAIMLFTTILCFNTTAMANDYAQKLKDKGFTDSYIDDLVALHTIHPNWQFEAVDTNLDWNDAVDGEFAYHKQIISNDLTEWYFCDCDACKVLNKENNEEEYKTREFDNFVGASKNAIKYYMDPRNFLNEYYIFQFESKLYSENENVDGVENIISSTWMHNANITYIDKEGKEQTYKKDNAPVKYSEAIIEAAKESGVSAYLLATKIVNTVGGKEPTNKLVSGNTKGFEGIYNYYGVGINENANDNLKWASYPNDDSQRTNLSCNVREQPWKDAKSLGIVNPGVYVNVLSETGLQSDKHTWCQVEATTKDGKTVTGFIRSDLLQKKDYNRPWTNPYLSIINGAKVIASGISKHQPSLYFQKFNVNNATGNTIHSREYMTDIRYPSQEGNKIYNSNLSNNSLNNSRTFYIPVFDNMPDKMNTEISNFSVYDIGSRNIVYIWDAVPNAVSYTLRFKNNTKDSKCYYKSDISNQSETVKFNLTGLTRKNNYTVEVKPILQDPETKELYEGQYVSLNNTTSSLFNNGWGKIDDESYYYDKKAKRIYSNGWQSIDSEWYYFYPNGTVSTTHKYEG